MTMFHEQPGHTVDLATVTVTVRRPERVEVEALGRHDLDGFGRALLRKLGLCCATVAHVQASAGYTGPVHDGTDVELIVRDLHVQSGRRASGVPRECGC